MCLLAEPCSWFRGANEGAASKRETRTIYHVMFADKDGEAGVRLACRVMDGWMNNFGEESYRKGLL